jgi:hypothetical protein
MGEKVAEFYEVTIESLNSETLWGQRLWRAHPL